ncbi:MAG: hypothetical protein ABSE68_01295, partial [Minisyncoccia bacterium]
MEQFKNNFNPLEEQKPINGAFENFEKTFNIKEKELEQIAEFKELTEGQKELALENFKQYTLSDVQKQAIEEYQKEREEAGFVKKIGMGVFKRFFVAGNEKEVAQEAAEEGINENGEIISEISKNIKESGLDGHWENGKFSVDYVGGPESFKNLTEEEKKQLADFNAAAQRMVEAKSEWVYGTGDKKFEKIKDDFEKARTDLLGIENKQTGSDVGAAAAVAEIDRRVYMNQWLNASPEAGKELEKIQSKWVWARALRNTVFERGGYTAMGYAGRTFAVGALGVLAAPLTAMAIGGWNARKRTIESIKEEMKITTSGGEGKLKRKNEGKSIELLSTIDAENLAKKIEELSERIENTPSGEEKDKLTQLMDVRLSYTHAKLDQGLVNFGAGKGKLQNQYNLIEKLTKAEVSYQSQDKKTETVLEERLNKFLGYKSGRVDNYIAKQMIKGMAMGAGFALLGAAIREFYHGGSLREAENIKVKNTVSADATGVKNLPIASPEKSKEIADMVGSNIHTDSGVGAQTVVETKIETVGSSSQVAAEKIQEHITSIKKGGSLWSAARELVKQKVITEKQFNNAWGNKHSTFFTSNNVDNHISKMDLVHEGDSLKYIVGEKGEAGRFILTEKEPGTSGTAGDLYDNYLQRNIKPPEWLRKEILGKQYDNNSIDELMEKPVPKSLQDWKEVSPLFKHEHHVPEV